MTQKNDPELVTSGAYRLVRHPIYSGILVAGAGTSACSGVDLAHRSCPGRGLLRVQRDRRGALPDPAFPRRLPPVQALDEDADPAPSLALPGFITCPV